MGSPPFSSSTDVSHTNGSDIVPELDISELVTNSDLEARPIAIPNRGRSLDLRTPQSVPRGDFEDVSGSCSHMTDFHSLPDHTDLLRYAPDHTDPTESEGSPAESFLTKINRSLARPSVCTSVPPMTSADIAVDKCHIQLGRVLGRGSFGRVYEARTTDDRAVAVKVIPKALATSKTEIALWRLLDHPHILTLVSVLETKMSFLCVTLIAAQGSLYSVLKAASSSPGLPKPDTARYLEHLADALCYLHSSAHVVHRDVKLENCLVHGDNLLLCDFGMAARFNPALHRVAWSRTQSSKVYASLPYASPEVYLSTTIIAHPFVDMWAFGVLAYALVMGRLPWSHPFAPKLRSFVLEGQLDTAALRLHADPNVYQVIVSCLTLDPYERLSSTEAHSILRAHVSQPTMSTTSGQR